MAAKILERCAEVIQLLVIQNQEAVVKHSRCLDGQRWVLLVKLRDGSRRYRRLGDGRDRDVHASALVGKNV